MAPSDRLPVSDIRHTVLHSKTNMDGNVVVSSFELAEREKETLLLRKEVALARKQLRETSEKLEEAQKDVNRLESRLCSGGVAKSFANLDAKYQKLQRAKKKTDATLVGIKQAYEEECSKVSALESALMLRAEDLDTDVETLLDAARGGHVHRKVLLEVEVLKEQLETATVEAEERHAECQRLQEEVDCQRRISEQHQQHVDALADSISKANEEERTMMQMYDTLKAENTELHQKYDEVVAEHDAMSGRFSEVEAELRQQRVINAALSQAREREQRMRQAPPSPPPAPSVPPEVEAERSRLAARVAELEADTHRLQQLLAHRSPERDTLVASMAELGTENKRLAAEGEALRSTVQGLTERLKEAETGKADAEARLRYKEAELDRVALLSHLSAQREREKSLSSSRSPQNTGGESAAVASAFALATTPPLSTYRSQHRHLLLREEERTQDDRDDTNFVDTNTSFHNNTTAASSASPLQFSLSDFTPMSGRPEAETEHTPATRTPSPKPKRRPVFLADLPQPTHPIV